MFDFGGSCAITCASCGATLRRACLKTPLECYRQEYRGGTSLLGSESEASIAYGTFNNSSFTAKATIASPMVITFFGIFCSSQISASTRVIPIVLWLNRPQQPKKLNLKSTQALSHPAQILSGRPQVPKFKHESVKAYGHTYHRIKPSQRIRGYNLLHTEFWKDQLPHVVASCQDCWEKARSCLTGIRALRPARFRTVRVYTACLEFSFPFSFDAVQSERRCKTKHFEMACTIRFRLCDSFTMFSKRDERQRIWTCDPVLPKVIVLYVSISLRRCHLTGLISLPTPDFLNLLSQILLLAPSGRN